MRNNFKPQDQFKIFERNGQLVFALNREKIIPENAPVRLASAMLEELDYEKLYGAYSPLGKKSAADPRVLFKVLVLGYMCGIYSSRKLEEACRYRIDFMWLLEDGKAPDHTTLARFRTGRCSRIIEDLFISLPRSWRGWGRWSIVRYSSMEPSWKAEPGAIPSHWSALQLVLLCKNGIEMAKTATGRFHSSCRRFPFCQVSSAN